MTCFAAGAAFTEKESTPSDQSDSSILHHGYIKQVKKTVCDTDAHSTRRHAIVLIGVTPLNQTVLFYLCELQTNIFRHSLVSDVLKEAEATH